MQNINNSLQEEFEKINKIDSFLESVYPNVSIPTKNLYRSKINKYMSGNHKSDSKKLEILLRQNVSAVKSYRKLFSQFLYYCKNKEKEIEFVKTQKQEGVCSMSGKTEKKNLDSLIVTSTSNCENQDDIKLPINAQIRRIPKYEKLVEVFAKDTKNGMNKKEIVKVFYPIVHNKRTYLSYFYSYLKGLNLWDGKDKFFINLATNIVEDTNNKNNVMVENRSLVKVENKKTLCLDDIIEGVKSLGLDVSSSDSILQILNDEKQKRELQRQKDIIREETLKYISCLKACGVNEETVNNIDRLIEDTFLGVV